jgi:hypothetical protein
MCQQAVQQKGWVLKYIPEAKKTLGLCQHAIQQDDWAILYVPKALQYRLALNSPGHTN